jgi:hypothetical protein
MKPRATTHGHALASALSINMRAEVESDDSKFYAA